nr:hypothetical protein [Tanacetum cinerariifolium]
MDLFNLISAPNPTKVKISLRLCVTHEVPLLTATASRVVDMEDPDAATESSGTSSTIEKSPLDFDNENPSQQITEEVGVNEEIAVMGPLLSKKQHKRGNDGVDENVSPKMLRKDHAASRSTQSTMGGKSLASTGLEAGFTFFTPTPQETPADVRDLDPLLYAMPPSIPDRDIAKSSHGAAIQILRSLPPLPPVARQYILARVGCSQRLPPEYLGCMLGRGGQYSISRATKRIAKQEQRIQVREEEIKKLNKEVQGLQNQTSNLKTLLKAEADMKKTVKAKNADLTKELESPLTQFSTSVCLILVAMNLTGFGGGEGVAGRTR